MIKKIRLFFVIIGLFTVVLSISRVIFFFKYYSLYKSLTFISILHAFAVGVRFDLSTSATLLSPFIILLFFLSFLPRKVFTKVLLLFLFIWEVILISYNFIDVAYFDFVQRHLTFEIGNTFGDLGVLIGIGLKEYLFEGLLIFLFIAVYALFFFSLIIPQVNEVDNKLSLPSPSNYTSFPLTIIFVIFITVVMIRGGFQWKPMGVKDAFKSENVELGILSLNGLYTTFNTLYHSYKGGDQFGELPELNLSPKDKEKFYRAMLSSDEKAEESAYPLYRHFNYDPHDERKMNVVIFVMESWSSKFSNKLNGKIDALPYFDALSDGGFLATNAFANAQRSIEGLAAIMGSLPVWKGMVLGQGGLLYQTRFKPMGALFKELGYDTYFIHGARKGSMGFDGLVKRLGFAKHISKEDFTLTEINNDPVWGIYDQFTFDRANEEFSKSKKPFLSVVFSLTSHSPYTFPKTDFAKFDDSVEFAPFLNSLKYSDWALWQFFKKARKEKYFKNTLFVIIGDHAEGASTKDNLYQSYSVPLLFYAPGFIESGETAMPVSQVDILPSIVEKLKISKPYNSWGKSVFSDEPRNLLLPRGDLFVYQSGDKMLLSDSQKALGLYRINGNRKENLVPKKRNEAEKLLSDMQKYLKLSSKLISDNRLAPPN